MRFLATLAVTAALASAAPVSAATVFFDDFSGDTANTLSLTSTAKFVVGSGNTVDVVGASNPWGITVSGAASGNVLDLDGTPGPATIVSKLLLSYNAGDLVTLSFTVGGSQRSTASDGFFAGFYFGGHSITDLAGTGLINSTTDGPNVAIGALGIPGTTPFTNSSISFRALTGGDLRILFGTPSADNVGPLLDNVKLDISAVPEPSTWALMLGGFALVGSAMRRRKTAISFA
jgi:hypothetical protein